MLAFQKESLRLDSQWNFCA